MIPFVAVLVVLACAVASARRVWFAANATALHPEDVHAALSKAESRDAIEALRALVTEVPDADWERDLLAALSAPAGGPSSRAVAQPTTLPAVAA